MGPRQVADTPTHVRPILMRTGLLALLVVASTAHALDVGLEPYREARRAGELGVVAGRIYAEAPKPNAQVRPMVGATVSLFPRSAALAARLQGLKAQARESLTDFTAAAPAMRKAKEAYERELLEAGAPELAMIVAVDGDGGFRIPDVPAGAWLVLAWHNSPVDVSAPKTKAKERGVYQPLSHLHGYQSVTVWLRDLTVRPGAVATLDLTDRNGWFRGVIEERLLDTGR